MLGGLWIDSQMLNSSELSATQICYLAVIENLIFLNKAATSFNISREMGVTISSAQRICSKLKELGYLRITGVHTHAGRRKPHLLYSLTGMVECDDALWMPSEVWYNAKLSKSEKIFLAEIIKQAENNRNEISTYFLSNLKYIKGNENALHKMATKLSRLGFIERRRNKNTEYRLSAKFRTKLGLELCS